MEQQQKQPQQEELPNPPPQQPAQPVQPTTPEAASGSRQNNTPNTEDGEIYSDRDESTEYEPSIMEVPAINWAQYVGCKNVQYVRMGNAPKVSAEENDWDTAATVREAEKKFSTDLALLIKETTNDPKLLKTLVALERQQHDLIPEEYNGYKKRLSTRFGLVFYEDRIVVLTCVEFNWKKNSIQEYRANNFKDNFIFNWIGTSLSLMGLKLPQNSIKILPQKWLIFLLFSPPYRLVHFGYRFAPKNVK